MGAPPLRVDVLMSLSGVGFEEAWINRQHSELFGRGVNFIGRRELIRNKLASGRHIDLHDAETLSEASEIEPALGTDG